MMLETLHKESFAACLNAEFQVVERDSAAFALRLSEVSDGLSTPRQEAFSVIFRGPLDRFIQQGTYQLRNEKLGELQLFLVPIARDNDGYQYEAVFNRLIQPG